jgi:tetratricopeptide (TPR) repeat protein
MSNVAKLKKQAAEFELKKQFDKALAVYVKLLESFDQHAAELDVALFNRVGDLMLRNGNVADAVDYYEQAVDRYGDTGFFNNAIALCNKILRHSPGRSSIYYKLGKISAQKGFKNDAKVNFLEYADRMKQAGNIDEAFRALKEFADLCPDQDEIRLMLADQLTKLDRKDEAIEQLQILYSRYEFEGRSADATATANRMRSIDPNAQPRSSGGMRQVTSGSDLIFLDLDAPPQPKTPPISARAQRPPPRPEVRPAPPPPAAPAASIAPPPTAAAPAAPATPATPATPASPAAATPSAPTLTPRMATPPIASPPIPTPPRTEPPPRTPPTALSSMPPTSIDTPLDGITRIGDDVFEVEKTPSESLLGLEHTHLGNDDGITTETPSGSLLSIDTTPVDRSSAPTHSAIRNGLYDTGELEFVVPETQLSESEPEPIDFDASALLTPPIPAAPIPPRPTTKPSPLDGLPLMELEVPAAPEPPAEPRPSGMFVAEDLVEQTGLEEPVTDTPSAAKTPVFDDDRITQSYAFDDDELVITSTPTIAHPSTTVAAHSVERLRASVQQSPDDWALRRSLAEAMLEAGDREGGIRELETAMTGAERSDDLDLASALAEEVARIEPDAVRHHQKRVEYAFRTNDRLRLIEAYLSLGDSLLRSDQADKARTVYQRVLDLAPDEARARAAIDTIEPPPPTPPEASRGLPPQRPSTARPAPVHRPSGAAHERSFVNLGDWLRDDQAPRDTRMVVAEQEPTGDEEADFADMLRKFKQGVAENVDPEDYQSHYDLAIAYKEMGLVDEAIAEFQKALAGPTTRLPTYEALGQCFLDKGQFKLASSILSRALSERASEDQLLGVLYWLGRAAEEQGNADEALGYYQRVFVLDIQFRDITKRMSELERVAR